MIDDVKLKREMRAKQNTYRRCVRLRLQKQVKKKKNSILSQHIPAREEEEEEEEVSPYEKKIDDAMIIVVSLFQVALDESC